MGKNRKNSQRTSTIEKIRKGTTTIELQQYRAPWISEKVYDLLGFYPRVFYCLDNCSSFKVSYQRTLYCSAEEAYRAQERLTGILMFQKSFCKPKIILLLKIVLMIPIGDAEANAMVKSIRSSLDENSRTTKSKKQ